MCEVCVSIVCCAFRKIPSGTFTSGGIYFLFLKISPPYLLSYPRGDCYPKKTYIPPRGVLRGYYGILSTLCYNHRGTRSNAMKSFFVFAAYDPTQTF